VGITTSSPQGHSMNNFEDILQYPFPERDSWSQFLIACAVMLAAFIIPILPTILM
jgi:hypothetical protein